ncbi:MAG: sodium:proton antiporter [Desulfobacterales bacterium]
MHILDIIAILITFSAVFSYFNYRYFHLPRTIGLMLSALILSSGLIIAGQFGWDVKDQVLAIVRSIDFNRLLLNGILGFLLFAGALNVELNELIIQKWVVFSLATAGVILSTIIVGGFAWVVFDTLKLPVPFMYCLLFGALISPTDPVAVISILKTMQAPKSLETQMAGESLFNDGVGVVIFIVLLRIVDGGHDVSAQEALLLFAKEAVGGIVLGLAAGYVTYQMLKRVDNYQVEILLTLGLVTGGYTGATALHTSGPLAIVAAGLMIGNHGRSFAMSETTRRNLDTFWELIDEILNAILFILIGMEVFALEFSLKHLMAGILIIPLVLLARLISVGIPFSLLRIKNSYRANTVRILTWGGLRGGIAVALALSLPAGHARGVLLMMTYMVVVFSIAVQGLTIGRLVKRWKETDVSVGDWGWWQH